SRTRRWHGKRCRSSLAPMVQASDIKRRGDELIVEDQAGLGGTQLGSLIQHPERDHQGDEWHKRDALDEQGEHVLPCEDHSCPCAGGGNAGGDRPRQSADATARAPTRQPECPGWWRKAGHWTLGGNAA